MQLIIVESPTKAKTISKFLKKEYKVESYYGHIRDLPKSKLGIDLESFEPQYIIPTKSKKTVNNLKKLAAKADNVILATDEDREGEAIAWHLATALNLDQQKTERIAFHAITKSAIEQALKEPRQLNLHLVDAQQGRRVLDRLVGYKLSPFLWKKVARGLSAGRVQSVAVRLIVEREQEIKDFKSEEYWTLTAVFKNSAGATLEAALTHIDKKPVEKMALKNQAMAEAIVKDLSGASFLINGINRKETKKNPLAPFTTSTLQQEAAKRLGFSSKKTMLMAQRLYENGLITYMRTDSVNLSKESLVMAKIWITETYGSDYGKEAPRTFITKSRLAQEAHEAIRPTDISKNPELFTGEPSEKKLYELIWSRFTASQMPQAVFDATHIDIQGKQYTFGANGSVLKFDGFLKIWKQKFVEKELPNNIREQESLAADSLKPEQHFTEPPPRYSEATLIKTLEEYDIGRPSTYAPIISVIQYRNYVEKLQGRFRPTEIGTLVTKILSENFPEIVDVRFTATMESKLDDIASGEKNWQAVLKEFYAPFSENLEKKYQEVSKKDVVQEPTGINCEKCGKPMIIKFSRFGKFLACSGFPDCRNTKQVKEAPKKIGLICPTCGTGDVIERRVSRGRARGKIFWGCSRYPDCAYASWTNPLKPAEEKEEKTEVLEEKSEGIEETTDEKTSQ